MNSKHKLVRWGALALIVTLMSGCCIMPWPGPGGHYHYQGGGYGGGPGYGGDRGPGGGWHH